MAIVLKDRVKETANTTGTGSFTLAGAAPGYQGFSAIGDGNTTYYAIYNLESGQWEVGTGTYTAAGSVLSRDTVFESSSAGAKVDFDAGVKDVFVTYPAERAIYEEPTGNTLIDGGPITVLGQGVTGYTTFTAALGELYGDVNNYAQLYVQNLNDGSDASSDFAAYNDLSDGETFFIDMGVSSSNAAPAGYPLLTPNSTYLIGIGDGATLNSDMFVGSGDGDLNLFAGGFTNADIALNIDKTDKSVNAIADVNVGGGLAVTGAASFSDTVMLHADPTIPLQAATKQYVDQVSSSGLHIHQPVRVERGSNLTATYTQGGTTFDVTDITGGTTLTTSTTHGLSVNDQVWFTGTVGNGLSANVAYFVYSTPSTTQITLSANFGGAQLTGLTNASGLTYPVRANSGEGATLTNAGAQAAIVIDGITLSVSDRVLVYGQTTAYENGVYVVTDTGSGATNWVLTRALDQDHYSPSDTNGMGSGDYCYVTSGNTGAGESYVLTTDGEFIIGYDALAYTQFSASPTYVGGTNIDITGQTISLTGTVAPTNGGTGVNTVTAGDLLYGSATDTWSKLALGTAYKSLVVNGSGTNVEWNAVALNQSGAVSGALGATNGGTGQSSYSVGDMLYSDATDSITKLAGNTTTTKKFLTQTGTGAASDAPAWGTISGSDVGGTVSSATNVAGGAANRILYQTGAGTTDFVAAPTTSGNALTWNGSSFAWAAAGATITNDTSTNTTYYPVWANATSGSMTTAYVSGGQLGYNPSVKTLISAGSAGVMAAGNTTAGIEVANNGGTGDSNMAMVAYHCTSYYAVKQGLRSDGYFGIGGWSAPTWRWYLNCANGDMTAAGNVTAYSDETLKTNWRDLPKDYVEQLAEVKHGIYDRTDENITQVGVGAQSLKPVLPWAVVQGIDGILSVAYGNAAMVSAVQLAKRVVEQEKRIARLEALVEKLLGD